MASFFKEYHAELKAKDGYGRTLSKSSIIL